MPETVACNLCGRWETTFILETGDRLFDLPDRFFFVCCEACGLIYLNPRPGWAERAAYYATTYQGYHRRATASSVMQRFSMEYGLHKRYKLISAHVSHGRLLDVGCGGGDFLDWMRRRSGWQVFGLERVSEIGLDAQHQYNLPIVIADQLQVGFAAGVFDVITLWTVLEHLQDPTEGLLECARILRQGGFIVVRTVNSDSWGARLFGSYWLGYDAPRIIYVFSKQTLQHLLEKTGFEVVHVGDNLHDFYPYLWSWRNLCKDYIKDQRLQHLIGKASGSWLCRLLSFPYFIVQTQLGKNSFVTAIARKR